MRKFSKEKKEEIIRCIEMLEYGDTIECDGTHLLVNNSCGCHINTIIL